jgi:hypothetical protein
MRLVFPYAFTGLNPFSSSGTMLARKREKRFGYLRILSRFYN